MDFDEEGAGGDGDDVVLTSACEVCGSMEFLMEAGFYFCKLCHFQSQESRQYIDEELVPDRITNLRNVSILHKEQSSKVRHNIAGERIILSTWEAFNIAIEGMTKALISIGFPPLLRDKVFQIWTAYLLKRNVIFVKSNRPDGGRSRITQTEGAMNLYALHGVKKPKVVRSTALHRRKTKKVPDDDGNTTLGASQQKRQKTMARNKAFEQDYLAHASQLSQLDTAYENVTGANQVSHDETGENTYEEEQTKSPTPYRMLSKPTIKIKKILMPNASRKLKLTKTSNPWMHRRVNIIAEVEKFSMRSVFILLFVAARQIGCRVVFSDFIRLFNDGTLYLESIKSILDEEDDHGTYHGASTTYFRSRFGLHITPECGESIEIFIDYIGIKNFLYPSFDEVLPKFIDDFALPREFECLMTELHTMFPFDEILEDVGRMKKKLKSLVELWILTSMVMGLRMLFGLDDVTEKYQSRFASTVNRILAKQLKRKDLSPQEKHLLQKESSNWCELFVLEDWFRYIRHREDLISRENFSKDCYRPQACPNARRTHDIIQTYSVMRISNLNYFSLEQKESCERIVDLFENISSGIGAGTGTGIPELPSYASLPLPKQSILNQYKEAHPNVAYPELKSSILKWSFEKKRIDFIWNPKKYIPMLKNAGYTVKIIEGDAINYKKKLKYEEKKLILFQPYKKFDDFSPMNCSESMKFIGRVCTDIISGQTKYGEESETLFQLTLNIISGIHASKALSGQTPLTEPPIFSTTS